MFNFVKVTVPCCTGCHLKAGTVQQLHSCSACTVHPSIHVMMHGMDWGLRCRGEWIEEAFHSFIFTHPPTVYKGVGIAWG